MYREWLTYKDFDKISNERRQFKKICPCSHPVWIYPKKGWNVCDHCGRKIFLDEEKQKEHDKQQREYDNKKMIERLKNERGI